MVGVKRSGTGVATLLDKVLGRNAPGWRGVSVVLVAAVLAAWLTVEVFAHWLAMERAQERQSKLQQTADALRVPGHGCWHARGSVFAGLERAPCSRTWPGVRCRLTTLLRSHA